MDSSVVTKPNELFLRNAGRSRPTDVVADGGGVSIGLGDGGRTADGTEDGRV